MAEFKPQPPSYSGDGIAIWKGIVDKGDNKGDTFLKVSVLGGKIVNCFKVKPKKQ